MQGATFAEEGKSLTFVYTLYNYSLCLILVLFVYEVVFYSFNSGSGMAFSGVDIIIKLLGIISW